MASSAEMAITRKVAGDPFLALSGDFGATKAPRDGAL